MKILISLFLCALVVYLDPVSAEKEIAAQHRYTYAWPFSTADEMRPRGGITKGSTVTLQKEPHTVWLQLQEKSLSKKEKDRRAIRAMSGSYRASFDFVELVGFTEPYQPARPYQSWGTEHVYILEDQPDLISLQHILVMTFEIPGQTKTQTIVVKHWRQDWKYQDTSLLLYDKNRTWVNNTRSADSVEGKWTQAVFQVDDSPRYESVGEWMHHSNYSSWESDLTRRPLPRREFSIRNDYDVLVGTNRHTITPHGWIHEEDNLKVNTNNEHGAEQYIAREAGFNRYERIVNHDFSEGHHYWEKTKKFWSDVRLSWKQIIETHNTIRMKDTVSERKLFEVMFEYADETVNYTGGEGRDFIKNTLQEFIDSN